MSERLPSREQAFKILEEKDCPHEVISHCIAVADLALELAGKLQKKGLTINLKLVEAGALLHDLGRSKTHTVDHAVEGAKTAESMGLPEAVVRIIRRHIGAGITADEAQWLGWPKDVYEPQTLEEKIVSYADKLIDHSRLMPIETEIKRLQKEGKNEAAERVRRLHQEITTMMGDEQ